MLAAFKATDKPIVSVDIPSGWDVVKGNADDQFTPGSFFAIHSVYVKLNRCDSAALISMTAPKLGAKAYADAGGVHWLGGRFMGEFVDSLSSSYYSSSPFSSREIAKKYELNLPTFPGTSQCVDITK